MKVTFLSLDPGDASARTRALAFFPALQAAGIEPELRAWPRGGGRLAALEALAGSEVVVLLRVLIPRWAVAALRAAAPALILDVDDAIWRRPGGRPSLRLQRRLRRTLQVVDLVTCGSSYLRGALGAPRVRLLPPAVDVPATPPSKPPEVEVLWTGSRATLPYLEGQGPALAEGLRGSDATLVVLADRAPRLPSEVRLRYEVWSEEAEQAALGRAQVGLYPLPRDAWSEGKCAYKVHLYLAHGLASLAVPWGGGAEALGQGGAQGGEPSVGATGLLYERPEELSEGLRQLLGDAPLRARIATQAHAQALAGSALELRARTLLAVLNEAGEIGGARARRAGKGGRATT